MNFVEISNVVGELLPDRCEIRLTVYRSEGGKIETRLVLYDYVQDIEIEGLASRLGIEYDMADLLEARSSDYLEGDRED
jgi:hypothetical protein